MTLYPDDAHWCSRADYAAILETAKRVGAKRVLEFGPGTSTLALIEAGAEHIDACEDDEHWYGVYAERLERVYPVVHMRRYEWAPVLKIQGVNNRRYDLAVIDGPAETRKRGASIVYALAHAGWVLVALEEHDCEPYLRRVVEGFARLFARPLEIWQTGPLAGSYALMGPPC